MPLCRGPATAARIHEPFSTLTVSMTQTRGDTRNTKETGSHCDVISDHEFFGVRDGFDARSGSDARARAVRGSCTDRTGRFSACTRVVGIPKSLAADQPPAALARRAGSQAAI